jgi:polyisoprenoid-binding protein YceI
MVRSRLLAIIASGALLATAFVSAAPLRAQETETSPVAGAEVGTSEASGIDGTWTVDTNIGDFSDFSSAWVGFRVAEVLELIGESEAVGRTPLVGGALEISGTTIESVRIEADLTGVRSDQARRDPAIQRALQTGEFPMATFESSGPVDLGTLPVEGQAFSVNIPGVLTIHGVSQDVEVEMAAQQVGDVVAAVGVLPLDFTSFGITMPTAPIVVSVADEGSLEWQLFFRRET